jgi:hypothetical protein
MQASYVEVRIILENLHYPVTKQSLIQQAIKHGASRVVIDDLKSIPDREYTTSWSIIKVCMQITPLKESSLEA